MAAKKLFANAVLPPTNEAPTNTYEIGTAFTLATGTWPFVGMGWYNSDPTGSPPTNLKLWRAHDQVLLATINPVNDNNTVGFQETLYGGTLNLVGGITYIATITVASGAKFGSVPTASRGAASFPLEWVDPTYRYTNAGSTGYPGNTASTLAAMVYPIVSDGAVTDTDEATEGGLENTIARWFSIGGDNTRTTHLPNQTYLLGQDIKAIAESNELSLASIGPAVVGAGGVTALTRLAQVLGILEGATGVAANLQAVWNAIQSGGELDQAGTNAANIRSTQLLELGRISLPPSGSGWTVQDVETGQGSHLWVQPADAYRFSVIDYENTGRFVQTVGIGSILMMRGWAKPWDGTFWYPEHVQVNGWDCIIRSGGRWPGIGLWVPPDVEWELTAVNYTGA